MVPHILGLVNTKISDVMIFTTAGWFLGKDCKMGAQCTDYLATEKLPKNEINEGFFMDCQCQGVPVVIGGENLPSPVGIGLTDLQNIGGASGPPGPPGSGTTELYSLACVWTSLVFFVGFFVCLWYLFKKP